MNTVAIFKDLYAQIFTIEDISQATGVSYSTLRMWPGRNIISLSTSYNPGKAGRGTKSLYSVYDAMQFLLIAEVAKSTVSVKGLSECCLSEILEVVLDRLSEIDAGIYHGRNLDPTNPKNAYERYVFIFEKDGKLVCTQEWGLWRREGRAAWYTIDAIQLAAKVYAMYLRKGLVR